MRTLSAAVLVCLIACGGEGPNDHTPIGYSVRVNGFSGLLFPASQTARVVIQFRNAAQEPLDELESDHFASLTLDPSSAATVARVPGHNFQFDVTGGPPAQASMVVGFGHDAAADEVVFPPITICFSTTEICDVASSVQPAGFFRPE
jgi:hypothetical protein